ncbi:MAG: HAD family phosphatase [Bacteroidales bacterium]|jgi:putative hydrolase of the HAD superfamily|nr:HAD family phosphatase [Bacteroidales bacterium]MDD4057656.1 HAD family phosphatase [Bacteroidales bacterium]
MIKNIIFDLGGVLVKLDKIRCIEAFKNIGHPDFGRIINEYFQDGFFMDYEKGLIDTDEFRYMVRKDMTLPATDKEIDDAMAAFLPGIPIEKLNALKLFSSRYRLFLLSNTNPTAIETVKPMFLKGGQNMEDYFEKMYLSFEMKCAKPDPKIFRMLLDDSAIIPEETLFVDDSKINLDAASLFGIKTALMLQENDLIIDLEPYL